ncbi:MAG: hypothetical protein KJ645_00335, partial [Planctomycetes bacterium]|nr:hypothetical protein [Planctomycetota bacterium]
MFRADGNAEPCRKGRILSGYDGIAPVGPEERSGASPGCPDPERPVCTSRLKKRVYLRRGRFSRIFMVLAVLAFLAVAFVGWEILERGLFPDMSTGMRHLLLTIRAVMTTLIGCLGVYLFMHKKKKRLSDTAGQLANILEQYMADPSSTRRFENPDLAHCKDVLHCDSRDCRMFNRPGERCWQVMALSAADGRKSPGLELKRCHECEVYRRSCPDKLAELGESFNNLLFLLGEESRRVGRMRVQMLEKE